MHKYGLTMSEGTQLLDLLHNCALAPSAHSSGRQFQLQFSCGQSTKLVQQLLAINSKGSAAHRQTAGPSFFSSCSGTGFNEE